MPCNTRLKNSQTLTQRAEEVRKAQQRIDRLIVAGGVKVKVGPQGAVVFVGISDEQRDGMTDACVYRGIMRGGSSAARMAITRAEQMAGRTVDRSVVARGTHSHDGGHTWHPRG